MTSQLFTRATWKSTIRESCGQVRSLTWNGCPKFGSYTRLNNPHLILCTTRSVRVSRFSGDFDHVVGGIFSFFLLSQTRVPNKYRRIFIYTQPLKDKAKALTFDNRCKRTTPSANIYACLHIFMYATSNSCLCLHHSA